MIKLRPASTGVLLALALAACGSSSNAPADAAAVPDGGGDATDGGDATGGDVVFAVPPGTRRLVPRGVLVGNGRTSCTSGAAASDVWCGFIVPGAKTGHYELWVFDATHAAAGTDVRCDGTDAGCLRLSDDAVGSHLSDLTSYAFQGETLFFRTASEAGASSAFGGPMWAWRPGWPAGRRLTAGSPDICYGQGNLAVALCLTSVDDPNGDGWEEIAAGALGAADSGPLPLVEKALLRSAAATTAFDVTVEAGFSPDGAYVAWSTGNPMTGVQTLDVQKVGDATTRATVASDVSYWRISNDGASWIWLKAYVEDLVAPTGTLVAAPFPGGADVSTVAMAVAEYDVVGAQGLLYRAGVVDQVGELRFMPDIAAPATSTLVDQGVRFTVARAADASTVVYSKTNTGVGADLFVWSAALAAPCTLTETPAAASTATLMAGNGAVVWAETNVRSQVMSGAVTSLASCSTKVFGSGLLNWAPLGDDRLLFVDGAPLGATTGDLRVARIGANGLADQGTPLQRGVSPVIAAIPPQGVLYTIANGAETDGLYVYEGPLLEN